MPSSQGRAHPPPLCPDLPGTHQPLRSWGKGSEAVTWCQLGAPEDMPGVEKVPEPTAEGTQLCPPPSPLLPGPGHHSGSPSCPAPGRTHPGASLGLLLALEGAAVGPACVPCHPTLPLHPGKGRCWEGMGPWPDRSPHGTRPPAPAPASSGPRGSSLGDWLSPSWPLASPTDVQSDHRPSPAGARACSATGPRRSMCTQHPDRMWT